MTGDGALQKGRQAPRWLALALVIGGIVLVPWTVYLLLTLPKTYTGTHYRGAWTGFDIVLLTALIITGLAAFRGSRLLAVAAAATGTLLFVDAWFDVTGSGNRQDARVALVMALCAEIPSGIVCWILAVRAAQVQSGPDPG
jgi:hypothetical protein